MQNMYKNATGDWITGGTKVFGGIADYLGAKELTKGQQAQAKALIEQGKSQIEVAKIMQETERLKLAQQQAGAGTGAGNKTLYIALGVGAVVILGVVVFAVTRKK